MRKNGFTLIELLAVIVILAIIAIIAVPIVLNIIEDTKNSATLRSADFYLDAVELAIAEKVLDGGTIDGEYTINSNGNICKNEECIEVEVGGQKPTSGKIIIEDGKIKSIYKLLLGGKTISTDSNGELAIKKYSTYNITYQNMNNTSNLPTSVEEGESAVIDLTGKEVTTFKVYINEEEVTNYTYENNILTIPNITGNVVIRKLNTYTVTYQNIDDVTGLPTTVVEENTLTVDLTGKNISSEKLSVKVNNEEISDYTYENYILTVEDASGNVEIIRTFDTYTVTYTNIEGTTSLPVQVIEGNKLQVDLSGKNIPANKLQVKVNNEIITDYTYSNNILIINNVTGNVEIIRVLETYTVTYEFIDSNDAFGLTSSITEGNTLTVDLKNKSILDSSITVKVNGEVINNYTYTNYKLTVPNVSGNVVITGALPQFSTDSWDAIIANVKAGNTSAYNVGDKKKITLTSTDTNVAGTYVVRLANKTNNDSVCINETNDSGATNSKTACGFIIEFVDIITTHKMNSTNTNIGGWPASEMREFVTPVEGVEGSGTIYNALPEEVRTAIIDTRVVSGRESGKSANYTSTDKLYLLSTKEVFGTARSSDKVSSETRQLDYYSSSGAIKIKYLNGTAKAWWLRSAYSNYTYPFYSVNPSGSSSYYGANDAYGVAAAFRLG